MFGSDEFVLIHITISLVAIGAGFFVIGGMMTTLSSRWSTQLFLAASVAANVTGLMFPFTRVLPSHVIAALSLLILAVALYAYYGAGLRPRWQRIFTITTVMALYLNVFVLIAQTFAKNPALASLAPTQSELPFAIVQLCAFLTFVRIGQLAVRKGTSAPPTVPSA